MIVNLRKLFERKKEVSRQKIAEETRARAGHKEAERARDDAAVAQARFIYLVDKIVGHNK